MAECITSFQGQYGFLSTFYPCQITYDDITYINIEAAYQAQKTNNEMLRKKFMHLMPTVAIRKGRTVRLRNDWEQVKENIMYELCKLKFDKEPFRQLLLDTGELPLINRTNNDNIWGEVDGKGENKLGIILMRIRKELQDGTKDNKTK